MHEFQSVIWGNRQRNCGGKVHRQKVTSRGTPDEIDAMIRNEVEALGSREGGLMLGYGLYPHTPFENAMAVADAMERYATYYA